MKIDLKVKSDITIQKAMKALNKSATKCLLVVSDDNKLLGTLTDGDIRKAILKGYLISDSIQKIYNMNPTVRFNNNYSKKEIKKIFIDNNFDLIPIINDKNEVVDTLFWDSLFSKENKTKKQILKNVKTVIMAGGQGSRLEPFTKVLPKPLIPIHDKTVIQHIIEKFTNKGVNDFIITINYKGLILKAFFQELESKYNYSFIEEKKALGTAGSLFLLRNKIRTPFFVSNCDIILDVDYGSIYNFHLENNFDITLVASAKEFTIPYGTCELKQNGLLSKINEKPKFDFLINTGLYVLSPKILDLIPKNKFYHITDLIEDAKNQGKKIGVYPIDEDSWIDTGQWTEYKQAIEKLT